MKKNIPNTLIDGVEITPLHRIADERGSIMHMLRNDDPTFTQFGEIYFSTVYPQVIKGWHIHTKMTLQYAVVSGMIKLVLFDARPSSKTYHTLMEIFIGEQNYQRVTVPPGVWNGFKGIDIKPSIVANCADLAHDPEEIKRMDPFEKKIINYNWDIVMR